MIFQQLHVFTFKEMEFERIMKKIFLRREYLRCHLMAMTVLVLSANAKAIPEDPPAWWFDQSDNHRAVIDHNATDTNSKGVANIGQAKFMVQRALKELSLINAEFAENIEEKLTIPQSDSSVPPIISPPVLDLEIPSEKPADWDERHRAPLLLGQLKAIARPFYDALDNAASDWLDHASLIPEEKGQLQLNNTKIAAEPANYYPWTITGTDDHNRAVATVGQLKAVFSLRFETLATVIDTDTDGLPDAWEMEHFGNLSQNGTDDPDGDGFTNAAEYSAGSDPNSPAVDADGDGALDAWEITHGHNPATKDNPKVKLQVQGH